MEPVDLNINRASVMIRTDLNPMLYLKDWERRTTNVCTP